MDIVRVIGQWLCRRVQVAVMSPARDERRESQSLLNGGGSSDASVEREWERAPRTCARCFQLSLGIVVLLAAAIAAAAASPWDRPSAPPPPPVTVQAAPSQTLRRELELVQQNTQIRQELRDLKAELAQLQAAQLQAAVPAAGKGGGRRRGKRQTPEKLAGADRRGRKGRNKALSRQRRQQPAELGRTGSSGYALRPRTLIIPEGGSLALECKGGSTVRGVSLASFGTPTVHANGSASPNPECHSERAYVMHGSNQPRASGPQGRRQALFCCSHVRALPWAGARWSRRRASGSRTAACR